MTTTVIYISGNYPHALRFFSFSQQDFNMMMMMIKRLIIDENKMKNKNEKKTEFWIQSNELKKERKNLIESLTHSLIQQWKTWNIFFSFLYVWFFCFGSLLHWETETRLVNWFQLCLIYSFVWIAVYQM